MARLPRHTTNHIIFAPTSCFGYGLQSITAEHNAALFDNFVKFGIDAKEGSYAQIAAHNLFYLAQSANKRADIFHSSNTFPLLPWLNFINNQMIKHELSIHHSHQNLSLQDHTGDLQWILSNKRLLKDLLRRGIFKLEQVCDRNDPTRILSFTELKSYIKSRDSEATFGITRYKQLLADIQGSDNTIKEQWQDNQWLSDFAGSEHVQTLYPSPPSPTDLTSINVNIWTHGSFTNSDAAGYGVFFGMNSNCNVAGRANGTQSIQNGELQGVVKALSLVSLNQNVVITTESKYVESLSKNKHSDTKINNSKNRSWILAFKQLLNLRDSRGGVTSFRWITSEDRNSSRDQAATLANMGVNKLLREFMHPISNVTTFHRANKEIIDGAIRKSVRSIFIDQHISNWKELTHQGRFLNVTDIDWKSSTSVLDSHYLSPRNKDFARRIFLGIAPCHRELFKMCHDHINSDLCPFCPVDVVDDNEHLLCHCPFGQPTRSSISRTVTTTLRLYGVRTVIPHWFCSIQDNNLACSCIHCRKLLSFDKYAGTAGLIPSALSAALSHHGLTDATSRAYCIKTLAEQILLIALSIFYERVDYAKRQAIEEQNL
jgi:ribonuclease HI